VLVSSTVFVAASFKEDEMTTDEMLPRDVEVAAVRQDVASTGRLLVHAANALKDTAGLPRVAPVTYAQAILERRNDLAARVRLGQYAEAATAYEGARVALADLTDAE
jgi:hypothetical protein